MAETLREALAAAREDVAQALPAIIGAWDNDEIDNIGAAELILRVVAARSPSPEGLDVERLRGAMRPVKRRVSLRHPDDHADYERGFREQYEPPTPEEVAAEYLRLADGSDG